MKKLLIVLPFLVSSCNLLEKESETDNLPFTHILVSFDATEDQLNSDTVVPQYWSYWFTHEGENDEDLYHYWSSESEGFLDKCEAQVSREGDILSLSYSCSVDRGGNINPSVQKWPKELVFDIDISVDLSSNQILSSTLDLVSFNKSLDLTSGSEVGEYEGWSRFRFYGNYPIKNQPSILLNIGFIYITDLAAFEGE